MRKSTFWFPTWSYTSHAVQLQKLARGLNFGFRKKGDCTIYVAKTKALNLFSHMQNVFFLITRLIWPFQFRQVQEFVKAGTVFRENSGRVLFR